MTEVQRFLLMLMDDEGEQRYCFHNGRLRTYENKGCTRSRCFHIRNTCRYSGISATPATYADATEFLQALIEAKNKMDEDEVPEEGRILYATPTLMNGVMALDTTKSREILNSFTRKRKYHSHVSIQLLTY